MMTEVEILKRRLVANPKTQEAPRLRSFVVGWGVGLFISPVVFVFGFIAIAKAQGGVK
jgi:hypothetical protein